MNANVRAGGGRVVEKHFLGEVIEWLFVRLNGVRPVSHGAVFRYSLHPHHGKPVLLADGVTVRRGDVLLELHLDNDEMARMRGELGDGRRLALGLIRGMRDSLGQVAGILGASPEAVAVYASTPHRLAMVAKGEGFETRPLPPGLKTRAIARLQSGVLRDYDPATYERLGAASPELAPVEIWMSRARMFELHAPSETRSASET
jgi:peptidoglycan-N-acetylglucosamine deacetylase